MKKTKTACDICGSERKIESYEVQIKIPGLLCETVEDDSFAADLCPKHFLRMVKFIKRGITKPKPAEDLAVDQVAELFEDKV